MERSSYSSQQEHPLHASLQPQGYVRPAEWLKQHGRSTVQGIALTFPDVKNDYPSPTTIRLPLQQLKQLRNLELVNSKPHHSQVDVMLQFDAPTNTPYGSTTAGSSSSAQAAINPLECVSCSLTSLKLHGIKLQPSSQNSYDCITALTALQVLDLEQPANEETASTVALTGALPQLTTLTKLHLQWKMSKALKAAVGQLAKLQELRLYQQYNEAGDPRSEGDQLNLPNSLTHLEVQLPHSFSRTHTPSLSGCTALQHLQLQDITELDPTMMKHMTRLTHLELDVQRMSHSNVSHLLDAMPAMQQLKHLQLEFGGIQRDYDAPAVERQQCGAFTSPSQLTSLQLSGMRLPDACGNQLFPPGRKLPHLKMLKIRGPACPRWARGGQPASQPISGSADVYSLIECCPNLEELDLVAAVQQGKSLSCLSHLAHLTELTVGGPTMDNICAAAVAAVTGLAKLTVIDPAPYKYKAFNTAARLQQGGG
jgi:hypothetical protein